MIIKNRKELATTELRRKALDIIEAGIEAVLPEKLISEQVEFNQDKNILKVQESKYEVKGRIFVIGAGKAAGQMAEAVEKVVGKDNIKAGIVSAKYKYKKTEKIKILVGGHPLPDWSSKRNAKDILRMKKKYKMTKEDLIICLISGGGSSLLTYPRNKISIKDYSFVTRRLLESGVDIQEINIVRKHLSKVKGGRLGQFFDPVRVVSLIISDVSDNDLSSIASGMTSVDKSTFKEAYDILGKYGLNDQLSQRVIKTIRNGAQGKFEETAKKLDNCFNHIIGDNRIALLSMGDKAEEFGFKVFVDDRMQTGEVSELAEARANELIKNEYPANSAIIIGSEATVKLPVKHGLGGRNMHYGLRSMIALNKYPGKFVCASMGTDGNDFLDKSAGVLVDDQTYTKALNKNLDTGKAIKEYDSYNFFKELGKSLILTDNTGTNVCDVIVYLLD